MTIAPDTTLSPDEAIAQAFGQNPVLEVLGPNVSIDDLPEMLSHRPLDSIPWQSVPTKQRFDFVRLLRSHFVPTSTAIEIALALQRTLRMGYVERNPLNREYRRRLHKITELRGHDVVSAPWFPTYASGMVIAGITGLGKSIITQRFFSHYPQVILHPENSEAGWLQLKQIVYLIVPMSADHSRGGFLFSILAAIDEAAGTAYHKEYFNTRITVERLMVVVGIILANHQCGYLVIDEIQKRNFRPGESRALILLFFLRLLNMGIPIVLIGNPEGFLGFDEFTQDVRRLYKDGYFELWPADSGSDEEWFGSFVEQKLEFTLLDFPFQMTPEARSAFFQCTAGVHDYFDQLYEIMLDMAIRSGRTVLDVDDIRKAYTHPRMAKYRGTIDALVSRDPTKLFAFEDISAIDFAIHWGIDLKLLRTQVAASGLEMSASHHGIKTSKSRPNFIDIENKYNKKSGESKKQKSNKNPANNQESAFEEERKALHKMMNDRRQF
jgi:hypothetical protein